MLNYDELREEPFFWSRLGFCYDPVRYDKNGEQIIFSKEYDYYRTTHDNFTAAGVKYHTTILPSGWNGDGYYDYTLTDKILSELLDGNPDIFYMPRVKLNAPVDWCRNHPREVFVYENGPRTETEIAELVNTPKHDWFGMQWPNGYGVNGGKGIFKDDRPNVNGVIGMQSFSSEVWLADACEALRRLIHHIDGTKYGKQIIGYHVAFGMCGETSQWGGWSRPENKRFGDFGIANTENFIAYGLQKYGSEDKLREVWNIPAPQPITVPSLDCRESDRKHIATFFYADRPIVTDYNEFIAQADANAIVTLCRTVKEEKPDFIAGIFYGYTYIASSANTGHLGLAEVLKSPYVDMFASPKGYYRSDPGDPGGEQGPSYSINRKKIWLDEIDNRTFLDRRKDTKTKTLEESETLLVREAVKNITTHQGFWWMDLGEGWYDHPVLMRRIRELTDIGKRANKVPFRSVAEILLVTDEKADLCHPVSVGLSGALNYQIHSEAKLCGSPVDTLRLPDLWETDVTQYKLVIFTNCYRMTDEEMRTLRSRFRENTLFVFHFAPAVTDGKGTADLARTKALTGFALAENPAEYAEESFGYKLSQYGYGGIPSMRHDFPLLEILPQDGDKILARYPDGKVLTAQHGNTVLSVFPMFTAQNIRDFAAEAGCYLYAPVNTTVYADNRVIGFFPKVDVNFVCRLPFGTAEGKKEIPVTVPEKGNFVLEYDR